MSMSKHVMKLQRLAIDVNTVITEIRTRTDIHNVLVCDYDFHPSNPLFT